VQYATGAWGDPTRAPLRVEAGRTTRAGYLQTLEHLNGLPLFIDEAHTARDVGALEALSYQFANGESYTRGGVDGRTRGGGNLSGTLFLAGEAPVEFRYAGANRRVLWIDCTHWRPLGADPQSNEGGQRAALLESAWDMGAGLFGLAVAEHIWRDWPQFVANVNTARHDAALAQLEAWQHRLAVSIATNDVALRIAHITTTDLPDPGTWIGALQDAWAIMLTTGHDTNDPATEVFARLVTILVQAEQKDDGPSTGWKQALVDRKPFAYCKAGEDIWRIPTSSTQFEESLGSSVVQLHGQTWIQRKWVIPGNDGKATTLLHVPNKGTIRVLCVPITVLETWT
jgi:hypothetical protein